MPLKFLDTVAKWTHYRALNSPGFGHQPGDLRLQLRLDLARVFIRQRAVPAGVGMDFRAVEPDRPHVQHAHLARQQQHLNEQPLDLLEKSSPERRNRVMVGMIVSRYEAERHRVIGRPLQLAARKYARRIAINKNAQQHSRMIRRRSRAAITAAHRAKVEPLDHIHNETRQMLLRKPLVHGWRKQKPSLSINRAKVAHRQESVTTRESILPFYRMSLPPLSPTGC